MAKTKPTRDAEENDVLRTGGLLGGLTSFLEKLGELAEKGQELRKSGEIGGVDPEGKVRGVYGFTALGLKGQGSASNPSATFGPTSGPENRSFTKCASRLWTSLKKPTTSWWWPSCPASAKTM